ncbi:alpha/beta hydrolase [Phormidium tenue FACHB-886]|nr:alpha/beta hydrolase [Phormidium tenue FACHB-886]
MVKPRPYFRLPRSRNPAAPLFIYLPGMDGTGNLLSRQLAGLEQGFDIRCLTIPADDLTDWTYLTEQVIQLIKAEPKTDNPQPIYLCGESFGGCLALKVITHSPHLFDRFILLNPASSFKRSAWLYWTSSLVRPIPQPLYHSACVAFLPFLAALERIEPSDRRALLDATQSVTQRSSIWRISLLREFEMSDAAIQRITQPALVIGGGHDRLLPSISEAQRLVHLLPNARLHVLPQSGHACLLEKSVDLYGIMRMYDFLNRSPQAQQPKSLRNF